MFYVYILKCVDGSYYTGHTDNLESRIVQHASGKGNGYTSTRLPLELVFTADFETRADALERERQIKGWSRRKKEALIAGNLDLLPALADTSKT